MSFLHEVCITGHGLLSALPEEATQMWQLLNDCSASSTVNYTDFPPYSYHPLKDYAVEQQIIKHSDRRVMGKVMQSAVYTAGVALKSAQLKNQPDLLKDTQMILALRGGDRDETADQVIIEECLAAEEYSEALNKGLMTHLRPTLFLSQLPNLLAANIALLFGLTGSSMTLMGAEMAGAQAIQLAWARIQSGHAQRVLVGGVSINESDEIMTAFAQAQKLLMTSYVPIWQRNPGGLCLGSASGFLLLESRESAQARGAVILGKLSQLQVGNDANVNWQKCLTQAPTDSLNILSMTGGDSAALAKEKALWNQLQQNYPNAYIRGLASVVGAIFEAAMPVGLILALHCLQHKKLFSPLDTSGFEKRLSADENLNALWVHCLGESYGHALFGVEAV